MKIKDWIVALPLLPIFIATIVFCANVFCFMFFEPFLTEDAGERMWIGCMFFFTVFFITAWVAYEVAE